ncbi:MAG: pyridoxamine 5'-phosphate oxidase family protein [Alphaproteobacteria bacterium]|nr:pyridoxamine 5'-phosphate oxidase family protein [Alphaproteobacteria bacterium]
MTDMTNYEKLMNGGTEIALATSFNNFPNVRIVNFVWDKGVPGMIYFATTPSERKIVEIKANNNVAFTTIGNQVVRVPNGRVKETSRDREELKKMFVDKMPFYADVFKHVPGIALYEISFDTAKVHMDMSEPQVINF